LVSIDKIGKSLLVVCVHRVKELQGEIKRITRRVVLVDHHFDMANKFSKSSFALLFTDIMTPSLLECSVTDNVGLEANTLWGERATCTGMYIRRHKTGYQQSLVHRAWTHFRGDVSWNHEHYRTSVRLPPWARRVFRMAAFGSELNSKGDTFKRTKQANRNQIQEAKARDQGYKCYCS
jgi:hypothetical protein